MRDLIDRQEAIDMANDMYQGLSIVQASYSDIGRALVKFLNLVPSAQPTQPNTHNALESLDCISRQAAIDALHMHLMYRMGTDSNKKRLDDWINGVPSVQPERTCVNCGRTANNGGWYADGRTRCPIEEHYALPKDGYCHLWEKRNVTDDDYPERRTDGRD